MSRIAKMMKERAALYRAYANRAQILLGAANGLDKLVVLPGAVEAVQSKTGGWVDDGLHYMNSRRESVARGIVEVPYEIEDWDWPRNVALRLARAWDEEANRCG